MCGSLITALGRATAAARGNRTNWSRDGSHGAATALATLLTGADAIEQLGPVQRAGAAKLEDVSKKINIVANAKRMGKYSITRD